MPAKYHSCQLNAVQLLNYSASFNNVLSVFMNHALLVWLFYENSTFFMVKVSKKIILIILLVFNLFIVAFEKYFLKFKASFD